MENDFAWRVDIETIKANGFNLDSKNPRSVGEINGDAEEMLRAYKKLTGEVAEVRDKLRDELRAALEGAAQ